MSRHNIDTIALKKDPQPEDGSETYISSFPWCSLIITEKLSSLSMLAVKGLSAEGSSSVFNLAFPEKHKFMVFDKEYIKSDVTKTKTGKLYITFEFCTHTNRKLCNL